MNEPVPTSAPLARSAAEPLARLYLLAVATLGLYLPFRAYGLARRLDPGAPSRARRLGWAAAVLFAPALCALLYEITRLTRHELAALGVAGRRRSPLAPALLAASLLTIWQLSPLREVWAALVVILPIPFLLVQDEINDVETVRGTREPVSGGPRAWPRWVVIAVGLPIAALVVTRLDGRALRRLSSSRAVERGAEVAIPGVPVRLRIPAAGWTEVGKGVVGDGDEDLALAKDGGAIWVMAYVSRASDGDLDDLVAGRRDVITRGGMTIVSSEEQRTFMAGASMVPLSFARHTVVGPRVRGVYLVSSAIVDQQRVEVIGFGATRGAQDEIAQVVASLRGQRRR